LVMVFIMYPFYRIIEKYKPRLPFSFYAWVAQIAKYAKPALLKLPVIFQIPDNKFQQYGTVQNLIISNNSFRNGELFSIAIAIKRLVT